MKNARPSSKSDVVRNVPPFRVMLPLPNAVSAPTPKVPPAIIVPPVNVLVPVNNSVPGPCCQSMPYPLICPGKVVVLVVLKVSVPLSVTAPERVPSEPPSPIWRLVYPAMVVPPRYWLLPVSTAVPPPSTVRPPSEMLFMGIKPPANTSLFPSVLRVPPLGPMKKSRVSSSAAEVSRVPPSRVMFPLPSALSLPTLSVPPVMSVPPE